MLSKGRVLPWFADQCKRSGDTAKHEQQNTFVLRSSLREQGQKRQSKEVWKSLQSSEAPKLYFSSLFYLQKGKTNAALFGVHVKPHS